MMFIAELLNVDLAEDSHTNSSADVMLTGHTLPDTSFSCFTNSFSINKLSFRVPRANPVEAVVEWSNVCSALRQEMTGAWKVYCNTAAALEIAATTTMAKATTIATPLPSRRISLNRSAFISSSLRIISPWLP
jgi:hypothetical protein